MLPLTLKSTETAVSQRPRDRKYWLFFCSFGSKGFFDDVRLMPEIKPGRELFLSTSSATHSLCSIAFQANAVKTVSSKGFISILLILHPSVGYIIQSQTRTPWGPVTRWLVRTLETDHPRIEQAESSGTSGTDRQWGATGGCRGNCRGNCWILLEFCCGYVQSLFWTELKTQTVTDFIK